MTGILDASHNPGISVDYQPRHAGFEAPRSTPVEWARRRREDREIRRAEVARGRAVSRLARLGETWKWLDVAELGMSNADTFLAIGPGGLFCVSVKAQGRTRVRVAGDVIQIEGKRPNYVAEAHRAAKEASDAISRTAGRTVPVTPIIAFTGSGVIDVHGLPKNVVITSYRELEHLLTAYGERISPTTVSKLYAIAKHPVTWVESQHAEPAVSAYTWYSEQTLSEKVAARR
jgi:hypothetical protein